MALTQPLLNSKTSERVRAQIEAGGTNWSNRIFKVTMLATLLFSLLVLAVLIYTVITQAWPALTDRLDVLLANGLRTQPGEFGFFQGLRGTFWIGVFVIILCFPVGIAAAIYLEEYATDNRLTRFIDLNIRNLAGVPSVVYGILGLTIFVGLMKGVTGDYANTLGATTTAGGLTLAILALPVVIITASEAIRAVPSSIKEAANGVGATKSEVIRSHILPYAAPGILTGTLLSLARALGETAPLILVGAADGKLGPKSGFFEVEQLGEPFTAMPIVIMAAVNKPSNQGWEALAAAAIVVLLIVVLSFNAIAVVLRNRIEAKREG